MKYGIWYNDPVKTQSGWCSGYFTRDAKSKISDNCYEHTVLTDINEAYRELNMWGSSMYEVKDYDK